MRLRGYSGQNFLIADLRISGAVPTLELSAHRSSWEGLSYSCYLAVGSLHRFVNSVNFVIGLELILWIREVVLRKERTVGLVSTGKWMPLVEWAEVHMEFDFGEAAQSVADGVAVADVAAEFLLKRGRG